MVGVEIGAYRLLEKIGEGGMGSVWMAEHTKLGRRAAIKLLHPSFSMRPEIVQRFFNEARAATAIADPGIVQIFDYGNHTDGSAYLVMALLEGETLHDRLKRAGAMAPPEALRVLRQVASTLGAAHLRGIVHRDLKPENIFLVRDPEVAGGERAKVLDFGIAKLVGDPTQTQQTNASLVLGTPAYMSPEQCRGAGQVDQRSDVYSLGCVFFALLTRRPPFVANGGGELIAMHLVNDPPRPSQFVANLPGAVEAVIMRCLAKDPGDRYANAGEFAHVLSQLDGTGPAWPGMSGGGPRLARTVTPLPGVGVLATHTSGMLAVAGMTTLAAATGMSGVTPPRARPNSNKKRWILIGGVCALGIGGGLTTMAITQGSSEVRSPSSPPTVSVESAAPIKAVDATVALPPPVTHEMVDPNVALAARITDMFTRFSTWAKTHAGAACPTIVGLGGNNDDPWGHPMQLTCTDQPTKQMIGALSAGPDGIFGTDDDIASWELGHDVTDLVRGPNWFVKPKPLPVTHPLPAEPLLDENGIPMQRKGT
ncbi:hypothetical protein BH11MYX1_BH11MYX1_41390 [soil metagenome]